MNVKITDFNNNYNFIHINDIVKKIKTYDTENIISYNV